MYVLYWTVPLSYCEKQEGLSRSALPPPYVEETRQEVAPAESLHPISGNPDRAYLSAISLI